MPSPSIQPRCQERFRERKEQVGQPKYNGYETNDESEVVRDQHDDDRHDGHDDEQLAHRELPVFLCHGTVCSRHSLSALTCQPFPPAPSEEIVNWGRERDKHDRDPHAAPVTGCQVTIRETAADNQQTTSEDDPRTGRHESQHSSIRRSDQPLEGKQHYYF
jgi:hypothetical protein